MTNSLLAEACYDTVGKLDRSAYSNWNICGSIKTRSVLQKVDLGSCYGTPLFPTTLAFLHTLILLLAFRR